MPPVRLADLSRDPVPRPCPTLGAIRTATWRHAMPPDPCLVTVIIPVFNSAATLARAARSALRQAVAPLELLIVDDGSTDASLAEATRIAETDPRARVIASPENRGK